MRGEWLVKTSTIFNRKNKIVFELFLTKIKYEMSTKITNDGGYRSFILILLNLVEESNF